MNYGISSIVIGLTGIIFLIGLNLSVAELFQEEIMKSGNKRDLGVTIFSIGKLNKLITLGLALLALLFGIKSVLLKNRIGILGIILSILLIILIFFSIWQYILTDSALDVNFKR